MISTAHASRDEGFSLLMVIWITTLLALQVSILHLSIRDGASLARNELVVTRGAALAAAGVEIAAAHLLERDPQLRWRPDGVTQQVVMDGALLNIIIRDETARIDINAADSEVLQSLLRPLVRHPQTLEQWIERIERRRGSAANVRGSSTDVTGLRQAAGAESLQNAPFIDPIELGQLLDLPPAAAARLAQYTTVFGADSKINPFVASRDALLALPGASRAEVDRFLALRRRGDETALGVLGSSQRWLTDRNGPSYRVLVTVTERNGVAIGELEAVILLGADVVAPFRVLSWRQDPKLWTVSAGSQPR